MTVARAHRALAAAFACCLLLLGTRTAAAQQDVLDLAPADAEVVIFVPSMAQVSGELAQMNRSFGLQRPELQDVLSVFKNEMGALEGVNDSGPAVIVMKGVVQAMSEQSQEPPFLMLLPVSDYGAFLGNYGVTDTSGIKEIAFPSGHSAFSKQAGGFAVLSKQQDQVQAYSPANQGAAWTEMVGGVNQDDLNAGDIVFLMNIPRMQPQLNEKMQELGDMMAQQMATDPQAAMAQPIMDLYMDAAQAAMRDGKAYMQTLVLEDEGAALTTNIQFNEGTPSAKMFANGGDSSSALALLPDQSYLMSAAMDLSGIDTDALVDAILGALPDDDQAGPLASTMQMYRKALPLIAKTKATSWAWYTGDPQAMMQPGNFFKSVTVYATDDPDGMVASIKQTTESLNQMQMPAGMPGDPNAQMTFMSTYTPNALQMEGVSVDQYQVQMQMPPQVMQQMGPMAGMMASGYSGFIASKGEHVLMTTSIDTQLLASALRGLDGGGMGNQGLITDLRGEAISGQPTMQMYISLQGIGETVAPFMMMMGGGPAIEVPADIPPVAMTLDVKDAGISNKLYVPSRVVQYISETTNQVMQQMQQGQRGGNPNRQPQPAPF